MNKLKLILAGLVVTSAAFIAQSVGSSASAATTCNLDIVDGPGNRGIKVNAAKTMVSATVVITGDASCRKPVTLAVWKLPNKQGLPLTAQKFFGNKSQMYGRGTHTITTAIPECYWQADLLGQMRPKSVNGNADYQWPQDKLANYRLGGSKSCDKPPKPPLEPTCSISVSKTTANAGDKVTVNWSSQNTTGGNITNIGRVAKTGSREVTITTTTRFVGTFTGSRGQTVTCEALVTVNGTPVPPPVTTTPPAVVTTASKSTPESLPVTGTGATVAAISGISSTLAGLGHFIIRKRFLF